MNRCSAIWLVPLTVGALLALAAGEETGGLKQEAQSTHYRLGLQIGPKEEMFSKAEADAKHPTSGEVMVSGSMAGMAMPGMSMGMDERHLEVHVLSRETGQPVTDAQVQITLTNDATGKAETVPIAVMYGVGEGPSDWHYGNNVSMPSGAYTVLVVVNGESALFHVTIPKM